MPNLARLEELKRALETALRVTNELAANQTLVRLAAEDPERWGAVPEALSNVPIDLLRLRSATATYAAILTDSLPSVEAPIQFTPDGSSRRGTDRPRSRARWPACWARPKPPAQAGDLPRAAARGVPFRTLVQVRPSLLRPRMERFVTDMRSAVIELSLWSTMLIDPEVDQHQGGE
jgi:hypothetical protein